MKKGLEIEKQLTERVSKRDGKFRKGMWIRRRASRGRVKTNQRTRPVSGVFQDHAAWKPLLSNSILLFSNDYLSELHFKNRAVDHVLLYPCLTVFIPSCISEPRLPFVSIMINRYVFSHTVLLLPKPQNSSGNAKLHLKNLDIRNLQPNRPSRGRCWHARVHPCLHTGNKDDSLLSLLQGNRSIARSLIFTRRTDGRTRVADDRAPDIIIKILLNTTSLHAPSEFYCSIYRIYQALNLRVINSVHVPYLCRRVQR